MAVTTSLWVVMPRDLDTVLVIEKDLLKKLEHPNAFRAIRCHNQLGRCETHLLSSRLEALRPVTVGTGISPVQHFKRSARGLGIRHHRRSGVVGKPTHPALKTWFIRYSVVNTIQQDIMNVNLFI
jgi:hypothetical protein